MTETIASGRDIFEAVSELAKATTAQATTDICTGAIRCVVDCFFSLRDSGASIRLFSDPKVNQFLRQQPATLLATLTTAVTLKSPDAGQYISAMIDVVTQHRHLIKFTKRDDTKAEPVAPIPALPVLPVLPPAPLEVIVLSMPDRKTGTEILRDGRGRITAAFQTEQDA